MNKKGAELALNTIIIAIIVLVVMAVVLMLFTGVWRDADFLSFTKCENRLGGDWDCYSESAKPEGAYCVGEARCGSGKVCCRKGDD
jgi:hypothetical protein